MKRDQHAGDARIVAKHVRTYKASLPLSPPKKESQMTSQYYLSSIPP